MTIPPDNTFALLAFLLCLTAFAAWAETTKIGRRLSGAAIVVFGATAASHAGLIPRSAPVYDAIWTYLVPLAVALFLFKADLIRVFTEGGRVLIAFTMGSIGVVLGALLGAWLLDAGVDEAKIAGIYTATYIGGSLNLIAVAQALKFNEPSQLAMAVAIDNVLGLSLIIFINVIAGWKLFQRAFPWRAETITEAPVGASDEAERPMTLATLLGALAVASAVVAISAFAADRFGVEAYTLLFITLLMTVVATVGRTFLKKLRGEEVIAMAFMYLFFAIVGVGANIPGMMNAAPSLFAIVLIIYAVHLIFMVLAGIIFKLNYAELVVASLACISGPPIVAAIAVVMNWRNVLVPGILTGILGYVVGNFVGIAIFSVLGGTLQ